MRKTREQVWRELDELGEEEVRERLAHRAATIPEPAHVHDWLERQGRVRAALAETSSDVTTRGTLLEGAPAGRRRSGSGVAGAFILLAAASFAFVRTLLGRDG